jgi:cardiolipin synthase A/B
MSPVNRTEEIADPCDGNGHRGKNRPGDLLVVPVEIILSPLPDTGDVTHLRQWRLPPSAGMFPFRPARASSGAGGDTAPLLSNSMSTFWAYLFVEGYVLTLLLVPFVLLQKRKASVSKLAWIMGIVALPYFGTLLFVVFGINRVERRAAIRQAARRQLGEMLPAVGQYEILPGETFDPQLQGLIRLADRVTPTQLCFGNTVEIVSDTNRTLGLIEQAILSAKESIHLEYYIWQPDRTGRRVRDLLIRKAQEGVRIRFLFDGIGSLSTGRKFLKPMLDAGIEVASALPGASFRERWSINLRNHRKIVIVDGCVGFTGGMNIGDEYIGRNKQLGFWRDTHLRLTGPLVLQLQQVFAEDWFFATGYPLTGADLFPSPTEAGDQIAQVVAGGPDGDSDVFHSIYFTAISEARRQITLATSYFIPTPALLTALEAAAYRGVRVRLMVPATGDHQWMVTAGRGYYEPLLECGVELYEYQRGLLHSKTLSIDGKWSLVGTSNFDSRSLLLNFEVGVILLGPRPAQQLEDQFEEDLQHAMRIDLAKFRQRPLRQRITEELLKLFAPVL